MNIHNIYINNINDLYQECTYRLVKAFTSNKLLYNVYSYILTINN
jgi:hypothetical protein